MGGRQSGGTWVGEAKSMSGQIYTGEWAEGVATAYLGQHYPELAVASVSSVTLAQGWLVQAMVCRPEIPTGGRPQGMLLMVNRLGLVEELGTAGAQRQRPSPMLDGLRQVNELIDLRAEAVAKQAVQAKSHHQRALINACSWSR